MIDTIKLMLPGWTAAASVGALGIAMGVDKLLVAVMCFIIGFCITMMLASSRY